ncbi:hypothetical protein [Paenibacillus sp. Leaf72]|uniref:hypothetical protein n=1 Tax=Paenibacillus sp. Leaf72 TaxID=1736234 RepID=UPI0006FA0D9E|nr:hypothetical protein [Paenibacillus sp. Leaf72]KQO18065.1 hypothetical protein ASF12_05335 [Paenibacillus sp. Leaf72]
MEGKIKLPRNVVQNIRKIVHQQADEVDYFSQDRNKNSTFFNNLVADPRVGGVLKDYMGQQRIRTYIKDSIMNRYSKDRTSALFSCNLDQILSTHLSEVVYLIERKTLKSSNVYLYRTESDSYIVVGEGTVIKWETALRRVLEFIENCNVHERKWEICLHLASTKDSLTHSDKEHIINSLKYIDVKVIFLERKPETIEK